MIESPRPPFIDADLPIPTALKRPGSLRVAAPGTESVTLSSREPRLVSSMISASFFSTGAWEEGKVKDVSSCLSSVVTGREYLLLLRMPSRVLRHFELPAECKPFPAMLVSPRGDLTQLPLVKGLAVLAVSSSLDFSSTVSSSLSASNFKKSKFISGVG